MSNVLPRSPDRICVPSPGARPLRFPLRLLFFSSSSCYRKTALKMHTHSYCCTPPPLISLHHTPLPPWSFCFSFISTITCEIIVILQMQFSIFCCCMSGQRGLAQLLCSCFISSEDELENPDEGTGAQRLRGRTESIGYVSSEQVNKRSNDHLGANRNAR